MVGVPMFITIIVASVALIVAAWAVAIAKQALTEIAIVSGVGAALLLVVLGFGLGHWLPDTADHGEAVRCAGGEPFALADYDASGSPCPDGKELQYIYCEQFYTKGLRQPLNTISDLGFVVASLWIALLIGVDRKRRTADGARVDQRPDNRMIGNTPVSWTYVGVVALMGPGSMLLHGSMKSWGGFLDAMTVLLWASLGLSYTLSRFARIWGWRDDTSRLLTFGGIWVALAALAAGVGGAFEVLGVFQFIYGGLFFLAELSYQIAYRRRDWGWTLLALGVIAVAILPFWLFTGAGLDSWTWEVCDADGGFQGHALFHLLAALTTFLAYVNYRVERDDGQGRVFVGLIPPTRMLELDRL